MSIRKEEIREAILKRRRFFSEEQIVQETGCPRKVVREVLDLFAREGLIRETERKGSIGRPGVYRINQVDQAENLAFNRMWKVIRCKRQFGLRDLIILGNANRENARTFLKALRRGGLIVPNQATGRGVTWTLIKDPGPSRPYVSSRKNTNESERLSYRHNESHE